MSRKFIAGVLAVSMSITGLSAAPAKAETDDLAVFLGTAATVFIIGKALESSNRNHGHVQVHDRHRDQGRRGHAVQQSNRDLPRLINRHATQPRDTRRAILPKACLRDVKGHGVGQVMTRGCLNKHYRSARKLPQACRLNVATRSGRHAAYRVGCLRDRGFRISAR